MAVQNGKKAPKKIYKVKINLSWKNFFLYGFLFLMLLFVFFGFTSTGDNAQAVPLSQVLQDVKNGKVTQLTVNDTNLTVYEKNGKTLSTVKEANADVYSMFHNAGVSLNNTKVVVKDTSSVANWLNIISSVLPVLLMVAFFYFIFRQARGAQESIFSFGKSAGKQIAKDTPKTTFADVAGVDEAKQELTEVVDFLKNPGKYKAMGARTPKGVLMVGPSGTGKTLLARATAGEAGVAFFSMAGSEFMEMLVGVGASRVRDLFNTAKKQQPAIIFIDEIDAIGRQRGVGLMGGHDEREQTLNQILVEMDGFAQNEQIVVMAATNRPDVLDPALVRPGRFDRRVVIDMPDKEGRKAILAIHAKNKPFAPDVDWDKVAQRTAGFSGADLENMLNEAAILAARLAHKAIDMKDIENAATKVQLGPEKKRVQSDEDKKMTAYHESGHALVAWYMPHMDPIHRISIVSHGMSLGHTMTEPVEHLHETRTYLMEQLAMMMGGRAAEQVIFGEMTTGASNDIEKATQVARQMVLEMGMSDLGPMNLAPDKRFSYESYEVSPEMRSKVDEQVKKLLDEAYTAATKALKTLRHEMDKLATALMKHESMDSNEFLDLIGPKKKVVSPFLPKIAAAKVRG